MNRIEELRKAKNISQEQLATRVGVTQSAISQWEKGLTNPAFKKLRDVANALETSVDDLLREPESEV